MEIKATSYEHILFEGEDMFLSSYCDDNNTWFWIIIGEDPALMKKGFKKSGDSYTLSLSKKRKYPYSAYRVRRYCIYNGYKYDIENIWHGLFILYPSERKTRRHLKLFDRDDSRVNVPYDEFIASSPTVWEERTPISDFVFDVEPLVYLFKDNSYIEENLHGAWYNKLSNKENE